MSSLDVNKTYKLFIGGAFPRSESGRVYEIKGANKKFLANPALASRKDLRDAVVAAKSAQSGWANATAFNRGQILYRIAEIMQGRSEQFVEEICALEGITTKAAKLQVVEAIDTWVWYSGWCDKLSSVSGSQNQVSGPFYNFDGVDVAGLNKKQEDEIKLVGADNLKRISRFAPGNHPERILSFMEHKTIWHPIGI